MLITWMTVPWGIRRGDDIMNYFTEKPGIGWEYVVGATSVEDSLKWSVQTGDQLIIYVCGDDLDLDFDDFGGGALTKLEAWHKYDQGKHGRFVYLLKVP